PGLVGQVEIRGPSVVVSYWAPAGSDPPERPATDPHGWLSTGDLGWVDGDGYVWLVGRVDDVINRGGEKIYPREIEEVLLAEPEVAEAAVVGRPDPLVGEVPVAFVRPRAAADDPVGLDPVGVDPAGLAARLAARCQRELSRRRRPVDIVVTDELPTGTNGKIRRSELRRALAPE
ncbi:MAG TPA: class I adenylate-forming enzyme family protein, partial [Acidimicrobiales bacterium]|nr:class I adenylate-forming enzyme family protein [Acidimicrobiales bacterium]